MKGVDAKTMSKIDRRAQSEFGIPEIVLMENAGRAVFDVILSSIRSIKKQKIVVFCGKGNNGGDGFVVARYLANEDPAKLTVFTVDMTDIKLGPAYDNYNIVRNMGIDIKPLKDLEEDEKQLKEYTISVDSIFGTGFKGELSGYYYELGKLVNRSKKMKRFAVDIPSGLDASTGKAAKNCFIAHKTITFGLPKKGFFAKDGPGVCGEVIVKNIGFPQSLLKPYM